MKIAVFGGTGEVGKHFVQQALKSGHQLKVLARPQSVPANWRGLAGLEIIEGSVLEPALVEQVVRGSELVVSSLGLKRTSAANPWSKLISPVDFASSTAQSIVSAMKKNGVKRVMAVSAAGVAETYPRLNGLMKFFLATSKIGIAYRDLERMEKVYRDSGLDWVACRPTRLVDTELSEKVQVISDGTFPMNAQITRADVAAWMLANLQTPLADRTPTITQTV
jgi:uncharacterized protein YbjT (DUF2867 family)